MSDTETQHRRKKPRRSTKKDDSPDSDPELILSMMENASSASSSEDEALSEIKSKFAHSIYSKINQNLIAESTNDMIQEIADYIHKTEEDDELDEFIDDSWKRKLMPKEIKKRTKQLKALIRALDADLPNIGQILDADLTNKEKGKAIQLFDILNTIPRFSIEYDAAKKALFTILGKHETLSPIEMQKCKELEEKFNKSQNVKMTIKQRIYLSQHSEENMQIMHDLATRLEAMPPNDTEYVGVKDIIDTALSLPVNKSIMPKIDSNASPQEIIDFLINLRKIFDEEIYGMEDVKDYIMEIISARISNPETKGDVIAFEGPPGTGKTLFVKCIAKAMGLPLDIITLAGAHDPSYIEGFLSTYSKSTYGRLIGALKKIQCDNGIILWDEVDKIDENRATAVSGPLIVIFDPEQNTKFKDKFLGDITMDVSKILHCITMNDRSHVNFIAANRMNIIKIRPLNMNEKIGAVRLKLIPEAMKKAGLDTNDIIISDDIIKYILNKSSSQEPGMRHHKRNLESIFNRINVLKRTLLPDKTSGNLRLSYSIDNFEIPLKLNEKIIDTLFREEPRDSSFSSLYT